MVICDGEEKHEHYQWAKGILISHTHSHTVNEKEFNRIHHHAPIEHENFTIEELNKDYEELDVPF